MTTSTTSSSMTSPVPSIDKVMKTVREIIIESNLKGEFEKLTMNKIYKKLLFSFLLRGTTEKEFDNFVMKEVYSFKDANVEKKEKSNEIENKKSEVKKNTDKKEVTNGVEKKEIIIDALERIGDFVITNYSEKAILVTGEKTKNIKEQLKEIGGKWNPTLKGWIL